MFRQEHLKLKMRAEGGWGGFGSNRKSSNILTQTAFGFWLLHPNQDMFIDTGSPLSCMLIYKDTKYLALVMIFLIKIGNSKVGVKL